MFFVHLPGGFDIFVTHPLLVIQSKLEAEVGENSRIVLLMVQNSGGCTS